jgi:hypothetical protein
MKDPCAERAFYFPQNGALSLAFPKKTRKRTTTQRSGYKFSLSLHQQCPFNFDDSFLTDFLFHLNININSSSSVKTVQ